MNCSRHADRTASNRQVGADGFGILDLFGNAVERILFFFRSRTNNRHLADGFKRIRTDGGFGGTHHRIGTVQYRVGHVADFRAGWYRVGNHGFHHLSCGNAEAAQLTGAADHAFL